jgi:16S rRNA G966 N2-methylase RsmD
MEHASKPLNEEETLQYIKKFPSLLKYKKKFVIFKREKDYKFMDETDKFAFNERMKCRRDKLSPMEYARKYKMTLKNVRKSRKVAECSLFPTPMALAVLQMFKAKKWLDPTAGWGDRLRSSLLANIDTYVGIDSNKSLEKVYKQIKDYYGKDSKTDSHIYISKFQDSEPFLAKHGKFDLVFTSPPFSMLEIYEHMNIVSDKEFQTDFMNKLFELSLNKLKLNGHLVLYIENVDIDYLTIETTKLFPKLKFEGAFYYEGLTKPRPYYVWKKV